MALSKTTLDLVAYVMPAFELVAENGAQSRFSNISTATVLQVHNLALISEVKLPLILYIRDSCELNTIVQLTISFSEPWQWYL